MRSDTITGTPSPRVAIRTVTLVRSMNEITTSGRTETMARRIVRTHFATRQTRPNPADLETRPSGINRTPSLTGKKDPADSGSSVTSVVVVSMRDEMVAHLRDDALRSARHHRRDHAGDA